MTQPMDIKTIHEKFIYPVVRVVSPGHGEIRGGSGVVVYSAPADPSSDDYETYIITNHHVVENLIDVSKRWLPNIGRDVKTETRSEGQVEFFEYENLSRIVEASGKRADLVAWDAQRDLGLLKLRSTKAVQYVAPIIKPGEFETSIFISTPVNTVGCALGVPPLMTSGHVGGFDFTIDNFPYSLCTAPSIYGNSGGGVFSAE